MLQGERERLREHLDQSDRAYSALETLVGRFLRPGSLNGSEVEVEILDDYGRIQQVLEDITDVIRHDLTSMHVTALVREVADRVLSRDRRQIDNGVRIRAIYHQRTPPPRRRWRCSAAASRPVSRSGSPPPSR
ncbi:hypothetical protein ABZ667_21660 [Streptomyces lavendulae]|uniref:hypothetical protein n=1 Tax=Streptomyces lavendulae TaxID=1914 RepID=UPI00340ADBF2